MEWFKNSAVKTQTVYFQTSSLKIISFKMSTSSDLAAHRNVIAFFMERNMTPTNTFNELRKTETHKSVSRAVIFKWHKRFRDGWQENEDSTSGRPKEIDNVLVQKLKSTIDADRQLTVREVSDVVGISKSSASRTGGELVC